MDFAKLRVSDDKKEDEVVLPRYSPTALEEPTDEEHPTDERLSWFCRWKELYRDKNDLYENFPWKILGHGSWDDDFWHDDYPENLISLKSSDNEVHKMVKSVAITESGVLKDMINSTGGRGEIPLQVPSLILSKITSFGNKKHKFEAQLNIIKELLQSTMDSYKAWITDFVKDNQSIFSQLHHAADFLNIPSLMELTSRAMRYMKMGSTSEEISERYSTSSIGKILSPLGFSLKYSS